MLISQGEDNAPVWVDDNHPNRLSEEIVIYTSTSRTIEIDHTLGAMPSSVLVYERSGEVGSYVYSLIGVPFDADDTKITLKFASLPLTGTMLKVKALI